MKKFSEDAELIAFFDWLSWQIKRNPILEVVHHVENERRCTPVQGARRKRKGVRSGIPDIVAPIPSNDYHGLYIEMKRKGGKVSDSQERIMAVLSALGYSVKIAYSADQAIQIFKDYFYETIPASELQ